MKRVIKGALLICTIMTVFYAALPQTAWASESTDRGQITIRVSVIPQSKAELENQISRLGSKKGLRQLCESAVGFSQLELTTLDDRYFVEGRAEEACESMSVGEVSSANRLPQMQLRTVLIRPI